MTLIAQWSFTSPRPAQDRSSHWGPLELVNGAQLTRDGLKLANGAHARASNYQGAPIADKTMIVWLKLDGLEARPAGSAMTLDSRTGDQFDGIVLGERQDRTWMAGSNNFVRTQDLGAVAHEPGAGATIQMAATYAADGASARVSLYRDGVQLASYTQGPLATWQADNAELLFGARHTVGDQVRGKLDATILGAELHDCALTRAEIAARTCPGPLAPDALIGKDLVLESVARPGHFLTVLGGSSQLESPAAVFRQPDGPADLARFRLRVVAAPGGIHLYWTNLALGHHGWQGKFGSSSNVQQLAPGIDGKPGTLSLHQGVNPWGQVEYWRLAATRGYGSLTLSDALELAHRCNAPSDDAGKAAYAFRFWDAGDV